jgi:hypothetical protein
MQLCSIPFLQIVSKLCGNPVDMIEFDTPNSTLILPKVILEAPKNSAQVEIFNVSSNEKVLINNFHQVENIKDELYTIVLQIVKNLNWNLFDDVIIAEVTIGEEKSNYSYGKEFFIIKNSSGSVSSVNICVKENSLYVPLLKNDPVLITFNYDQFSKENIDVETSVDLISPLIFNKI